ncbi:hypothetical protein KUTeg_021746 [Tegillarca granosa]|uniref:DUF4371 domain-containing protein n=1 Tax=Tegillarca granosa TaxID=220873 RepID=A0ABQ9E8N0_TEGGR|nr:hypothetical protein KUTeg_021746 [Tegillarca granosa]
MQSCATYALQQKSDSVISAMQTTYWLAKENIPSKKYESLLEFLEFKGVDLNSMKVGSNASNKSRATVEEFQECISEVIESNVLTEVRKSPFISILCDESTDISNEKKLILYCRIINPDTFIASTHFVGNVTVEGSSCTAEVLFNYIINFLSEKKIDISKVIGFGSDGAYVMTGCKSGVATRFREKCPHLISIHCMAHRLNLSNREAELKQIQKILESPELKVKWLAFYDALTAVFNSYGALINYFKKNNKTKKSDIDIAAVKPAIQNTLTCIKSAESGQTYYQKSLKENLKSTTVQDKTKVTFKNIELVIHRSIVRKATEDIAKIRTDFISSLNNQMTARFPVESQNVADSFDVLGLRNLSFLSSTELESHGIEKIDKLCAYFGTEKTVKGVSSPPIVESTNVLVEWSLAKNIIKREMYPRDRMHDLRKIMHTHHHKDTFPNLLKLAAIALCPIKQLIVREVSANRTGPKPS